MKSAVKVFIIIGMIRKWGVAGSAGQAGEEDIRSKD